MNSEKIKVHFTDSSLINAVNPVTVNLIGAGGTGSKVLTALIEMNDSLLALEHPGLSVRLWDDDVVSEANIGRQRFAKSEIGLYKSSALINRANRWAGTNWKTEIRKFERDVQGNLPENAQADLFISCVDTVQARFEIAEILKQLSSGYRYFRDRPKYLMDFGNSKDTGQVQLCTVESITQPCSEKYQTVDYLPLITEEHGDLLKQSEATDNTPSCSLAEALEKQDLYINGSLAQMGSSLLWGLFRNGLTHYRGFFMNLKDFRSQPIPL